MTDTGSVIVSWNFTNGTDAGVLLVGKQEAGKPVQIINAFQGEEAEKLTKKLTIRNYGKGPVAP